MSDTSNAETITPPNPLDKAKNGDGPVKIDPNVLREAEKAVEDLGDEFPVWARQDVDALQQALADAQVDPANMEAAIGEIYKRALDLKGQGGGFGYSLVTSVGDLLTKFLEGRTDLNDRDLSIVTAHVDALNAVLRDDIKGDGGQVGNAIVDGLHQLVVPE